MQRRILSEPALCLGLPVYLCAAFLFPLHLGWNSTSYLTLAGYLAVAGALFTAVDVATQRGFYRHWQEVGAQAVLTLLTISLPAVLVFSIGQAFDRSEEVMEDELCAMSGYAGGSDTPEAEADDAVDVTPDCVVASDRG
ncbi:MAG TPA: hypothetical protein VI168_05005 [Croceibacterium sp.]